MQNTAQVIPITEAKSAAGYRLTPTVNERVKGNGRKIFVKRLRDIADAIERGELDGARAQWLDTHGEHLEDDGTATSGMEVVTRTAWTDNGSGQVKLQVTTIVEEG